MFSFFSFHPFWLHRIMFFSLTLFPFEINGPCSLLVGHIQSYLVLFDDNLFWMAIDGTMSRLGVSLLSFACCGVGV